MPKNPRWPVADASVNDSEAAARVRDLAAYAQVGDGVAALSEHSLLHLASPGSRHLTVSERGDDGELAGYAQVWADGAGELVVRPGLRRSGIGTALWAAALEAGGDRLWAHGDLPAAGAFAAASGLERVRELHKMSRPLTPGDAAAVELPQGYTARAFVPGQDDEAWLATNAAAFAHHPEQGSLTQSDLDQRMAQPWFDAADFLVVEDVAEPGRIVAFHWTKVEEGSEGRAHDAGTGKAGSRFGETYVVGVDPAYQGRGLAGPLTRLGIAHLARLGLSEVVLYVDGDNVRALSTYRRAGFGTIMVDVVYAPVGATPGTRTVRMEP